MLRIIFLLYVCSFKAVLETSYLVLKHIRLLLFQQMFHGRLSFFVCIENSLMCSVALLNRQWWNDVPTGSSLQWSVREQSRSPKCQFFCLSLAVAFSLFLLFFVLMTHQLTTKKFGTICFAWHATFAVLKRKPGDWVCAQCTSIRWLCSSWWLYTIHLAFIWRKDGVYCFKKF